MFFRSVKEINRLISKGMSNIYLKVTIEKNWCSQNFVFLSLKETHNSFKKHPLNPWCISGKTIIEVGNITKAATFKICLHLSYKNT